MEENLQILEEEEILNRLKDFPGWNYKDNKIYKEFTFKSFMDAVAFIVKLAPISEKNDHHPDIHIFYKKILFELQRFDVGGKVTNRDFFIASEIERLYSS
jgi:4a-hydroxytetrahydrobiopterin dehydratase